MTKEMDYIKTKFSTYGRKEKIETLKTSNLNDREALLLYKRLVQGQTLKECAEYFRINEDSVNKAQLKAIKKLYFFMQG